jgi:flagellar motility protein MotE (MotC chaperone)
MKSGYDQFFKQARRAQSAPTPTPVQAPRIKVNTGSTKQVAEQLRARVVDERKKKNQAQAKRKRIPWKLAGVSFLGLVLGLLGMQYQEKIDSSINKFEVSLFGQAYAEETKPVTAATSAAKTEKEVVEKTQAKKEYSTEEIDHFSKLNDRRKELDAREAELGRAETELQAQKANLELRLNELEKTRKDISQILEEKVQSDDKKVDALVQMYSSMKPQQAAKVLEAMDEDLAVEIIGRMKKKSAAEVMNLMKSEKAQAFSEKYAGYKRK